ncbi:hypothetical protein COV22_03620, partial [Candidatus Woesearchaeota archaeon CG10_big_fil_rev_8_21_14_0_10_47_5]
SIDIDEIESLQGSLKGKKSHPKTRQAAEVWINKSVEQISERMKQLSETGDKERMSEEIANIMVFCISIHSMLEEFYGHRPLAEKIRERVKDS